MRIAIIGYGKMGKTIESLAVERGHEIILKISSKNLDDFNQENLKSKDIDVAIEFTRPEGAAANIRTCILAGVPVVSGTTGWLDKKVEIEEKKRNTNCEVRLFFQFSIG